MESFPPWRGKCAEIALARGKNDDDKVMCAMFPDWEHDLATPRGPRGRGRIAREKAERCHGRHASGRREESAPRRAEQAAEGSTTFLNKFHVSQSDFHFRNYIFAAVAAVTKPHLFRYRSVSLRAAAAWVGRLGRRLAPRALLISHPQHTSMTVSTRACRGRACVSKYQ